jgi:hypothetical protein
VATGLCASGCGPTAGEERPPFVEQLVVRLQAEPKANPPASIWRYRYEGRVVFYVPPSCCDVPSALYDGDGNLVCSPDGGITGGGDGRCSDFFSARTDEQLVWADTR